MWRTGRLICPQMKDLNSCSRVNFSFKILNGDLEISNRFSLFWHSDKQNNLWQKASNQNDTQQLLIGRSCTHPCTPATDWSIWTNNSWLDLLKPIGDFYQTRPSNRKYWCWPSNIYLGVKTCRGRTTSTTVCLQNFSCYLFLLICYV